MAAVITSLRFNREKFLDRFLLSDRKRPDGIVNVVRKYSGDLEDVDMTRLSNVVILSGPNGSGKSRTLGLLRHIVGLAKANWPNLANLQEGSEDGAFLRCADFDTDIRPSWVNVSPIAPTMKAIALATDGDFEAASKRLEQGRGEFEDNSELAAIMAKRCFDEFWDATHQHSNTPPERKKLLEQRWKNWCTLVGALLRKEMKGDSTRNVYVGEFLLDQAVQFFSEGEKRLFALSATLASGSIADFRRVIICDEPESHLHPEAAVEVLTKVRDGLPADQLWIATHSLPIIAALGWENVSVAEGGRISFAGRSTERIIDGLLGGRDNIVRLRALIDEPAKAAMAKFATESLLPPRNSSLSTSDPQFPAVGRNVQAQRGKHPVKVLDWGAGGGRLPYWISGQPDEVRNAVDYNAFEREPSLSEDCRRNIGRLYDDAEHRLFTSVKSLREAPHFGSFDCIVLSNVLHEIPIRNWQQTFTDIHDALDADGHLLVMEDLELPAGELPTREGFLLLTLAACQALFNDTHGLVIESQSSEARYKERLKCYVVPRGLIAAVSADTIRAAVHSIKENAFAQISKMRAIDTRDYKAGTYHALYLCLYASADLAIEALSKG